MKDIKCLFPYKLLDSKINRIIMLMENATPERERDTRGMLEHLPFRMTIF